MTGDRRSDSKTLQAVTMVQVMKPMTQARIVFTGISGSSKGLTAMRTSA